MRKLSASIYRRFGSVYIHRDDIEEIIDLVSEASGEVWMEALGFEFKYPEEMDELVARAHQPLEQFTIRWQDSSVVIAIDRFFSSIHISRNDAKAIGIATQIADFLGHHQRITQKWRLALGLSLPAAASCLVMLTVSNPLLRPYHGIAAADITLLLTMSILGVIAYLNLDHMLSIVLTSRIDLKNRHESPTFLGKHRDAIIVGAIVAAVTALIGVLVSRLS